MLSHIGAILNGVRPGEVKSPETYKASSKIMMCLLFKLSLQSNKPLSLFYIICNLYLDMFLRL